jgi:uncharacterized membrane protein
MYPEQARLNEAPAKRIEALDVARGLALVAMAIYHFAWDLEFFGYANAGMTATGGWKLFARCIASSFLFLVGVSLFLAHSRGIRWRGFWRRLAMVSGAAAAISLVTWLAVPGGFIFFGILHQIALASLLGLAFLRLPWWLTLIAAAVVIAAPNFLRSEFFDHPAWWWMGLSPVNPRSNDYVPVFPWFGAVLIGIALAKLAASQGFFTWLAGMDSGRSARPLAFAGRHSLAVYLIHQPVLIASLWLFALAFPAPVETPQVQFRASCEATCEESRDVEFCTRYCVCVLDRLEQDNSLDRLFAGDQSAEMRSRLESFAGLCTVETDNGILEGGAS